MEGNSREITKVIMQTKNDFEPSNSKDNVHCKDTSPGLLEKTLIVAPDENPLKNKKKNTLKDVEVCKKRRMNSEENSKVKLSAEGLDHILKVEKSGVNLPEVVSMPNNNFELMNEPEKSGLPVLDINRTSKVHSSGCKDESSFDEQNDLSKGNAELITEKKASECNLEDYYFRPDIPSLSYDTDHGEFCVCEKVNNEETFPEAIDILKMELNKACTDRIETSFISMLQCINIHVMELQSNKDDYEIELRGSRKTLIERLEVMMCNLTTINSIYFAFLKKCSNPSTLARERKSVKSWKKYAEKLRLSVKERLDELNYLENLKITSDRLNDQFKKLAEDQSRLQDHLTEMNDQLEIMQSDHKRDMENLDEQLADLRETFETFQQRIRVLRQGSSAYDMERNERHEQSIEEPPIDDVPLIPQDEARIISLACIFLSSHPGASINTIYSYFNQIDSTFNIGTVENVMRKFSTVFQEEVTNAEGQLHKKWYYLGVWQLEHTLD